MVQALTPLRTVLYFGMMERLKYFASPMVQALTPLRIVMEFGMVEQLKYFASPVHHLGTKTLVDGAPGVGRNAGASLSSDL
jgi:hypothetical protein